MTQVRGARGAGRAPLTRMTRVPGARCRPSASHPYDAGHGERCRAAAAPRLASPRRTDIPHGPHDAGHGRRCGGSSRPPPLLTGDPPPLGAGRGRCCADLNSPFAPLASPGGRAAHHAGHSSGAPPAAAPVPPSPTGGRTRPHTARRRTHLRVIERTCAPSNTHKRRRMRRCRPIPSSIFTAFGEALRRPTPPSLDNLRPQPFASHGCHSLTECERIHTSVRINRGGGDGSFRHRS